jgi:hypothetical protein
VVVAAKGSSREGGGMGVAVVDAVEAMVRVLRLRCTRSIPSNSQSYSTPSTKKHMKMASRRTSTQSHLRKNRCMSHQKLDNLPYTGRRTRQPTALVLWQFVATDQSIENCRSDYLTP